MLFFMAGADGYRIGRAKTYMHDRIMVFSQVLIFCGWGDASILISFAMNDGRDLMSNQSMFTNSSTSGKICSSGLVNGVN